VIGGRSKTDRNSVFVGHEVHILHLLYIIALYIIFYGLKNQISDQNPKVL
jgi:hypothetical protein